MPYTVAVIGCGVIGKRLGNAFRTSSHTELKYAVDINPKVLSEYCEIFNTKGYSDYKDVLQEDVDIIYVGVPPKFHHKIVEDAISHGKHVICEKPISTSADIGRQMTQKANSSDVVTAINFVFRHMPSFSKMKNIVADGKIGKIDDIEIRIRMPQWPRSWQDVDWLKDHDQGGPLREIGSHFIFAVQEMFGEIEVLNAHTEFTKPGKFEKSIQAEFQVRDINGRINLICLNDEEGENTLYINGQEGNLRFRSWRILEREEHQNWVIIDDNGGNTSLNLIEEFCTSIEQGKGDLVSFYEATKVQQVIDDIFRLGSLS